MAERTTGTWNVIQSKSYYCESFSHAPLFVLKMVKARKLTKQLIPSEKSSDWLRLDDSVGGSIKWKRWVRNLTEMNKPPSWTLGVGCEGAFGQNAANLIDTCWCVTQRAGGTATRRGTDLDSFWDVAHSGRIHPHQTSHLGDDGLGVFKSGTQETQWEHAAEFTVLFIWLGRVRCRSLVPETVGGDFHLPHEGWRWLLLVIYVECIYVECSWIRKIKCLH